MTITNADFSDTGWMNYTLVLETPGSETESVQVALEFINNGGDFYGAEGIVPSGCKFYLVGELAINDANTQNAASTGYKVFKQDYKTQAKFTISSLKLAENTIPDLRNAAVELGLSVDLEWQKGVTFSQTFN